MLKISDRVLLGTVSGLLASLPMLYLVGREAEWGLVNPGQGLLAGRSTAPTVGIATTYLLSLTGTEGALFKGAALSTVAGLFSRLAPGSQTRLESRWADSGLVNRPHLAGCAAWQSISVMIGCFPSNGLSPTYSHEDYLHANHHHQEPPYLWRSSRT